MRLDGISPIGWVHTAACILALIAGALQLWREKGTPPHRAIGTTYVLSMIVLNLSSLFIYKFDVMPPNRFGPGVFGFFHYGALFTLLIVLLGWYSASRQKAAFFAYLHPFCMIFSYYLLLAALVNESFARINWLRETAMAMSPGVRNFNQWRLVQRSQSSLMLVMIVALFFFLVRAALYRRAMKRAK
jgi:uncharacterized membrane protein